MCTDTHLHTHIKALTHCKVPRPTNMSTPFANHWSVGSFCMHTHAIQSARDHSWGRRRRWWWLEQLGPVGVGWERVKGQAVLKLQEALQISPRLVVWKRGVRECVNVRVWGGFLYRRLCAYRWCSQVGVP